MRNIQEVVEMVIESLIEDGERIPKNQTTKRKCPMSRRFR